MQAGLVRKNGHMVIKGRPCKVIDVSTSKTGKHGHAKCHFVAQDIFTGKKMEDLVPSSHNLAVPNVTRTEYQVRRARRAAMRARGRADARRPFRRRAARATLVVPTRCALAMRRACRPARADHRHR